MSDLQLKIDALQSEVSALVETDAQIHEQITRKSLALSALKKLRAVEIEAQNAPPKSNVLYLPSARPALRILQFERID